jgi:hypothetical protein
MKLRWRFGVVAGIVLLVCGMYPQMKMWYLRGDDWQGHYAYNDVDEVAYASYIRALIDGRPRRNDPYTGRDDTPENPQAESLFSIQFAAPYLIALPTRALGISAPTAMWLSGGIFAFLTALACFWLVGRITDDSFFALAATLVVLCGGALAAGEGASAELVVGRFPYPYFPGFRRYVPAVPFPFFFTMCALVWLLVTGADVRKRIVYCVLASLCFAFMVFSYFYTWTTAAAWLACVALVWLVVRPAGWQKDFRAFLALGAACGAALVPYAILLSNRSHTMDDVQMLLSTRAPDLLRPPAVICYSVLAMLILAIRLKAIDFRQRATLFAFSFALAPLVVFNQQVITGRSLQPIHYQVFIGNYVAALALVVTVGLLWREFSQKKPFPAKIALTVVALIAAFWGIVECHYTTRPLDEPNIERDQSIPVARRLAELHKNETERGVVMAYSFILGDDLPTIAPQPVLWARHQHVFAGVTWQENKERYYRHLYYMNLDENWLAYSMKNSDFVSIIALFGWSRHSRRLNAQYKPLTFREINQEAARYAEFRRNFSFEEASNPALSYLVVPKDWRPDFTNLDKWYERSEPEIWGDFLLYQVKLKVSQ